MLRLFRGRHSGAATAPTTKLWRACDHRICYAVKANSNLAVLALLAQAGAGFDIVSGGELFRVLKAGGDPASVVFSGVGKTADEIEYALDQRHPQLQLRVRSRTGAASTRWPRAAA